MMIKKSTRKTKGSRTLNSHVLTTTLMLLSATVVVLSVIFFLISSAIVMRDGYALTELAVENSGDYIGQYLERLKATADVIANHSDTIEVLQDPNSTRINALSQLMATFAQGDQRLKTIALISKNGKILSAGQEMLMTTTTDMMSTPWYQEALHSEQMPKLMSVRRSEFSMDQDDWVISVSREIVGEGGDHLGVLLMDIDYRAIEAYLKGIDLGTSGYAFIITTKGDVVYHPDAAYYTDKERAKELVAICDFGQGYESKMGLITFKTDVAYSDWVLVGLSSLDNVNFLRRQLLEAMAFATLLMLAIGTAISYWTTRRITRPLNRLQLAMQTLDIHLQPLTGFEQSPTEVLQLSEHYNGMLSTIHDLMADVKENERKLRDYALSALQSQINPHFLYNTLETIIWLSEFGDSQKVVLVTKSLSEMLRFGLRQDDGTTALSEELDHVKHYLHIQKERYAEELDYTIDVNGVDLNVRVPKLILQPIVENAIYHGIRPQGRGSIQIVISHGHAIDDHQEGDQGANDLIITILDNGVGYQEVEDKTHSKSQSRFKSKARPRLGGVGLKNVAQRIKLLCGDAYGLTITNLEGAGQKGTRVEIKIPIQFE